MLPIQAEEGEGTADHGASGGQHQAPALPAQGIRGTQEHDNTRGVDVAHLREVHLHLGGVIVHCPRQRLSQRRLRADVHLALTLHHCVATHPDRKEILHAYLRAPLRAIGDSA